MDLGGVMISFATGGNLPLRKKRNEATDPYGLDEEETADG